MIVLHKADMQSAKPYMMCDSLKMYIQKKQFGFPDRFLIVIL